MGSTLQVFGLGHHCTTKRRLQFPATCQFCLAGLTSGVCVTATRLLILAGLAFDLELLTKTAHALPQLFEVSESVRPAAGAPCRPRRSDPAPHLPAARPLATHTALNSPTHPYRSLNFLKPFSHSVPVPSGPLVPAVVSVQEGLQH